MYRLTNQDFSDILDLIHISNSHLDATEMRRELLHAMKGVFQIQGANSFPGDKCSRMTGISNVVSLDFDRHCLEQYLKYYYHLDPFRSARNSRKVVCKSDDFLPYSRWVKLEYYNDFLKPAKIHHILGFFLRSGHRLLGTIGLYRRRELPNFSEREMLMAHILAPHITTALENISLLSKIEGEKNALQMASESSLGILLLDFRLRPVYWNSQAEENCLYLFQKRLDGDNGVNGENGHDIPIPPEILQDCLVFKELYQRGNQITPLHCQRIMCAGRDRRFMVISRFAPRPFKNASTPHFLVSLEELPKIHEVREEATQVKYRLTEREREIVQCVSEGLTNDDVARRLFISQSTVANHLQNIFEKTGVKNRTELANRLTFTPLQHVYSAGSNF